MGWDKLRRPLKVPSGISIGKSGSLTQFESTALNVDMTMTAATNGVKFGRLVRVKTDGAVVPTTGTSGRAGIGITLSSASSGSNVLVRVFGIVDACPSTHACAKGALLRGASGGSTSVNAGCVRSHTAAVESCIGLALTSAAAAAVSTGRTVRVLLLHYGQALV